MATKPKKVTSTKRTRTASAKRIAKAEQMNGQFISVMVMIFTVLSIIFLLVVIQNYL